MKPHPPAPPDPCFPVESELVPSSRYCLPGQCVWYGDEPMCPHPRGCDRWGGCVHPGAFGEEATVN